MKGITFIRFHRKALFFYYLHYFSTKFITFPSPWVWWRSQQPSWSEQLIKTLYNKKQARSEWGPAELKALSEVAGIGKYFFTTSMRSERHYFYTFPPKGIIFPFYFSIKCITFPSPWVWWRSQQPSWSEQLIRALYNKKQEWDDWGPAELKALSEVAGIGKYFFTTLMRK